MKPDRPLSAQRPSQDVPAEIIGDLMAAIRNQFYADAPAKSWFQDQKFILRNVVLWPAAWLNRRGVSLPAPRYKEIVLEVFNGVKTHGQTAAVKYWPGYLMKCVQEHFRVHGEDYYDEGKSLRVSLERALLTASRAPQAPDPISRLAEARRLIQPARRAAKPTGPKQQLSLL